MREYDNPCDEPEDDWWVSEQVDKIIKDSPQNHLCEWLAQAYPEVFKQWSAIYDIEREV
jgi:hypothetical protein